MSAKLEKGAQAPAETVDIEVDGVPMQVAKGSMIIEATDQAGIDIPRFCYHPKLSIAANCRMCLVDVEKMPKPMPACATPVMDGMKVYTKSRRATDAQHGVMEFLLINHPLDCPICDQGGECELQDLAMGYGRSVSRFTERKRVVKDKNVGPLIQTEMTRCIHCTRCIRFLDEIAGTVEMGGVGRGDRLEIGTCVENSIDSELSGNIIDLCPVGALTNKPFRFAARAWELVAKPAVAVHDGVGSSVWHHVRRGKILRTVPRECEARNESWLSDRDRYSHLGLDAEDRVLAPQVKQEGVWKTVSWDEAITITAGLLRQGVEKGGAELGALMSPSATSEEYFLAQALLRKLGCNNIDHRLREQDFADDPARAVSPAFRMEIADIDHADTVLLIGSNVREEVPILGHRVRQAARRGGKVSVINPLDWPFTFDTDLDAVVAPQHMVGELAALAAAVEKRSGTPAPAAVRSILKGVEVTQRHEDLAARLAESASGLVLLGQFAMSHPQAAWLRSLAAWIAEATDCALNLLPHGGNSTGAWLAGALPQRGPGGARVDAGLDAAAMLARPLKSYLLWDIEPDFDIDNPARAMAALQQAGRVICFSSFATDSLREVADVILPLAPLAESEGSLVNLDGTVMNFSAAGKPDGEARAGWKILRRLAGELGLEGFDQVSLQDVQEDMNRAIAAAEPVSDTAVLQAPATEKGLYRAGELPMYSVDALCRRSGPLQQTAQADSMFVGLNPADAGRLGLSDGDKARVRQGEQHSELEVRVTERVPAGAVWLRSATCASRMLEHAVAPVSVEVA